MVDDIFKHGDVTWGAEVRTRVERRRRWTAEEKGRIVAASFAVGAVVSDVARQHGLSPQHLFLWRKAARAGRLVLQVDGDAPMFAPVVITPDPEPQAVPPAVASLDVEIAGAVIRVTAASDLSLLPALVRALKASA